VTNQNHPASLLVASTAICAALFAVGAYATAYIPSPWGFGQFRPAVVIPALFGAIFGPFPAAIGAALGTLIADSAKHQTLYMGSLLASVPGNFVGFFIFGYMLKKKFNWTRFIAASVITLIVGNLITAFLYIFLFKAFYMQALVFTADSLTYLSIGLTIYWFVTMLPFVLLITPPLIRAVASAMPAIVPESVRIHSLKGEMPKISLSLTMIIPGVMMALVGFATTYTVLGDFTLAAVKNDAIVFSMVELMYYLSGVALVAIGFVTLVRRKMRSHGEVQHSWSRRNFRRTS
jgi:hypothetical protein